MAIACCLRVDPAAARIARILDTKHLEWFYASEPLLDELSRTGSCEVDGDVRPIAFGPDGSFLDELPA